MNVLFTIASAVAVISTVLVLTQVNAVHALLYFIVSLLSVALLFFILGAPFVAALEVIIYAGAIMVLFVFVIMMLNLGTRAANKESQFLSPETWAGPAALSIILCGELIYILSSKASRLYIVSSVDPKHVGNALLGPYVLGVELASILLLAGLAGAYHLGRNDKEGYGDKVRPGGGS
jgi:NADH-quinone oxidoreductase subunit J